MWEISEGDTKFLNGYELVLPKDLGSVVHLGTRHCSLKIQVLGMKVSTLGIVHPSTWHYSLKVPALCMKVSTFGIVHLGTWYYSMTISTLGIFH